MKKLFFGFLVLILIVASSTAHAVSFEAGDMKFGINGYLDLEYTYMGSMPMADGMGMLMSMPDESYLDQHHMNLLFDAERGKFRAHLNLQSLNAYTTRGGNGGKGNFEIAEAYGEYTFNDLVKLKAGYFLMPFGIYNEVYYITSLFSSVVLPQMYELPRMYEERHLIHESSNLMVFGTYLGDEVELTYNLHIGNGNRNELGIDANKNKLIGGRLRMTLFDNLKAGISYCTVEDNPDTEGRNDLYGVDLVFTFFNRLNLQAEYLMDEYTKRKSRMSYYAMLTYDLDKFKPFVAYDYLEDKESPLYKKGMNRWGTGLSYYFSDNIILKNEYHYHAFSETDGLPDGTDSFNMFRTALIFIF